MAVARLSLRTLALFLFCIVVAAMLCLLAYFGVATWRNRVSGTLQRLEYQAMLIAAENNQAIADTREFIRVKFARNKLGSLLEETGCDAAMAEWSAERPRHAGLGIVLPNGDLICSSNTKAGHFNIRDRPYFRQALNSPDLVIGQAVISRAKGTWHLPIAQAIRDDQGHPAAVVVALLDLANLSRGLSAEVDTAGIQVGLFDAGGRVLARYPDPGDWIGKSLPPYPQWQRQGAAGIPFSGEEVGIDGVRQLFALVPFAQTADGPVKLWLGVDKARIMGDIQRDFAVTMAIALVILLASMLLIWTAANRLVLRRIEAISRAARRLGEGDLSARIGDPRHSDEIGQLASDFDTMAASLASIEALTRSNRALRVLAAGTAVIPHAVDEQQMIESVCRAVAEAGAYRLVWIGYVHDPDGSIERVACTGPAATEVGEDVGELPARWQEGGKDVLAASLRDGKAVIVGPPGPRRGVEGKASMLVLPLAASSQPIGVLCICDEAGTFSEDSLILMQGLAVELAAAIEAHRARKRHAQLETSLQMSEQRFRAAAEAMLDALLIFDVIRDTDGEIIDLVHVECNEAACRMLTTTRETLIGKNCSEGERVNPAFIAKCLRVLESGTPLEEELSIELPFIAARWVRHQIVPMGDSVLVIARDITAGKQAEQALRQSEQRWQFALEGAEQGVWDWDIANQKAYYSPRLQAMYGLMDVEYEETSSGQWTDRIHPDDLPAYRDAVQAHLRGETDLLRAECRYRKAGSDTYTWILTRGKVTERDAEGRPMRLTGTITDITKRKTAALDLEASRELYRSLAEALPLGLYRLNLQGRLVFVNHAMATMISGKSGGKSIGRDVYEMSLAGDLVAAREADRIVMESGEPMTRIEEYAVDTQEKRQYEVTRVPVRDSDGKIIGLQGLIRDVTARLRAQEQRRLAALVFESTRQGIVVMNTNREVLTVNPAFTRITGYSEDEARGQKGEFITASLHDSEMPERVQAEATLHGHWEGRTWNRRKNGEVYPQFVTFDALSDDQGNIVNFVAMLMDVSEAVRAEEKIRKLNEELEQRVEERTRALEAVVKELEAFSYSVSHDLRAPLRGIDGFTRIIEQKYSAALDEAGKGYLHRVRRSVDRMEQLIDDMLMLSRVTRSPVANNDVDVSRIARDILTELSGAASERVVNFDIQEGIRLYGDPRLLRIVLENLIGNAWKFSSKRETTRIQIGTENTTHGKAVFIRDNGAGFDMRYVDKLFVSFQRLHSATEFEGTGIGLAIVQRVINRHGGRIWAEGAVGVGATFYFVL